MYKKSKSIEGYSGNVPGRPFFRSDMIEERSDKDRVKCPVCRGFIIEAKPGLPRGYTFVTRCPKCRNEVEIKKE